MNDPVVKSEQKKAAAIVKRIKQERRIKVCYIREDLLINWFANGTQRPITGFITFVEGIPDDAIVLGVQWNMQYGAFEFLLGSLEFDPVPEGEYAKPLTITVRQTTEQ